MLSRLVAVLLGLTLACNEGPSGLSAGNLSITISGLPTGSPADLIVTGPEGYSQPVTGAQTLSQLTAGTYTVTAHSVAVGSAVYTGMPESQNVAVGGSTAVAAVVYSTGSGNLNLTITGLGTASNAAVTVTGPNGYNRGVVASEILSNLPPGTYTVTAADVVASGGTTHTPSPATQDVSVPATGSTSAAVNYAPPSSGPLNLRVAGLYVTQSTQTYDGGVHLVKDRSGYLRVFGVASRTNTSAAAVRVRVYNSANALLSEVTIPPPGLSVPTSVDESALANSWNTPIPGAHIQPGFRVEAEIDPAGVVPESDEADNAAAPVAPVVQAVPELAFTFVPVIQQQHAARGDVGNVTAANKEEYLSLTRRMHPMGGYGAVVRAPYTTTTSDTLQDDNGNKAWGTILAEIEAIRVLDDPSRYYYGVVKVSYTSGVAGVAYVSNGNSERSALGWDHLPSGGGVAAHELGHNWGRNHAPCGIPSGVDDSYPYADGRIGAYGLDLATGTLKPAATSDIMGYCEPKWIGDYTYKAVLNYLTSPPPLASVFAVSANQSVQPCLLVWGHMRDGELVLEPSFQVNTRPRLPVRPGPYTVEARAEDGSTLFNLSFRPSEIADVPGNQQSFVFAVPLSSAQAARLGSLRLSGLGREALRSRAQATPSISRFPVAPVQLQRLAGGKVGVRWNAGAHPMVMVRDAQSGEVLSLAREGSVDVPSDKRVLDVVLSDGVRSRVERLAVSP